VKLWTEVHTCHAYLIAQILQAKTLRPSRDDSILVFSFMAHMHFVIEVVLKSEFDRRNSLFFDGGLKQGSYHSV